MERQRCPHCGHPSPPSSPGTAIEDMEKRPSPVQSWDFFDSNLTTPTPTIVEETVEPSLAGDLYRPFWDFLGLTVLSVCSLLRTKFWLAFRFESPLVRAPIVSLTLQTSSIWYIGYRHKVYFFLTPASFPWFLVVVGFFVAAWTVYYILRQLGNEDLTSAERSAVLFDAHLRFQMAVCLFCLLAWVFVKPFPKPWFIFVFSAAGVCMTLHYSISYIDCKRMWLFPQLQLYLNTVVTCFLSNTFYSPPFSGAWWLWPTCIWGLLLILQLIIFTFIVRRRARLGKLDNEEARRETFAAARARKSSVEKPLLADFMQTIDEKPTVKTNSPINRNRASSPLRPPPRTPQQLHSPVARVKQHQLVAPTYIDPHLSDGMLIAADTSEAEDASLLVEYVSTPPHSARFLPTKTAPQPAKHVAMRVVHHDEHSNEAVEGSLTGSEGIYIDVVHIPRNRGFG